VKNTLLFGKNTCEMNENINVNDINSHFANICKKTQESPEFDYNHPASTNPFVLKQVTNQQIIKVWRQMKNKENMKEEETGICNKMIYLTIYAPNITSIICHMINLSIMENNIPSILKITRIMPIPKIKNPSPTDYRPISIIPILLKILEKLVFDQLSHYVMSNNIIHDRQFGFKKGHSTTTYMCSLMDLIYHNLANAKVSLIASIDLKKAFDKIDRELLIKKLMLYGIKSDWFESYLRDRLQFVEYSEKKSTYLETETGIPQGSALSGLLFTIFLNDMPQCCVNTEMYQYADDTNTVKAEYPHKIYELISQVQTDINNILIWLKNNNLELNESKTQIMLITNKKFEFLADSISITVGNQVIKCVPKIKCLGLIIDCELSWKDHIIHVTKKANATMYSLYPYMYLLTHSQRALIVNSHILSIIMYLFVIWGNANCKQIESINKVIKRSAKMIDLARKYDSASECLQNNNILLCKPLYEFNLCKIVFKQLYCDINYFKNFQLPQDIDTLQTRNGKFLKTHKLACASPRIFAIQSWMDIPTEIKTSNTIKSFSKFAFNYYMSKQNSTFNVNDDVCNLSCIESAIWCENEYLT